MDHERLSQLAFRDPIIRLALAAFDRGDFADMESAMVWIIGELCDQRDRLYARLLNEQKHSRRPPADAPRCPTAEPAGESIAEIP